MAEKSNGFSRYMYKHETGKWPAQTIDLHHVVIKINSVWIIVACLCALIFLRDAVYSIIEKGEPVLPPLLVFPVGAFFIRELRKKLITKESVVIIPAFGVQLETHYWSGRTVHRFVPIDKILKPLLNECVTPTTCYWSLALILRDEDELMLVFKELCPPFKMLAPIWKALCAATNSKESMEPNPHTTRSISAQ